jgi:hypothetical protein
MINETVDPHQVTLIVTMCYLMRFRKGITAFWLSFETFKFRGNLQIV